VQPVQQLMPVNRSRRLVRHGGQPGTWTRRGRR
jgi:hypothetical protein